MQETFTNICPISGESLEEERVNFLTHLAGLILSIIGVLVLVIYACLFGNSLCLTSCAIYGLTLVLLYTASTFYHGSQSLYHKSILRTCDHACIYLLIAGSFTPFALGPLKDSCGSTFFWIEWSIAALGVVFKLFATHRFELVSTLTYIGMGWLAVFSFPDLAETVPIETITLLVSGGLSYSFGTLFFLRESLPFNHGIWHLFVLAGGICHYLAIFSMVLHNPELWN